ncbi:MAG TPA: 2OG-Fe(II) oxygenase [Casimicrobiaceae bacterium]|nr:2OG-Fe(II) oxygenase [Casimicrobiaceae bacterium]
MKLVPQQPGAREIKVKLMLAGGHAAMLVLPPEHPLLTQLLQTIADPANGRDDTAPATLFQIPIEGGRASLTFASHQLVGVITDPAVLVQPEPDGQPAAPKVIRHPFVQLDGFLSASELEWLRDTVLGAQSRFVSSWTSDDSVKDYRQSLVLQAPAEVERLIVGKIRAVMPEVIPNLRMPLFTVGRVECQVTASTDGSYFRPHTDQGKSAIDTTRKLTYVYYFNREPKRFNGGELRVYDDEFQNGKYSSTDTFQVVEPRNNSIVFFNAAIMHEVAQVQIPSKDFGDSRFTVNGWIHRT